VEVKLMSPPSLSFDHEFVQILVKKRPHELNLGSCWH
jgi:hypothetical protein